MVGSLPVSHTLFGRVYRFFVDKAGLYLEDELTLLQLS